MNLLLLFTYNSFFDKIWYSGIVSIATVSLEYFAQIFDEQKEILVSIIEYFPFATENVSDEPCSPNI